MRALFLTLMLAAPAAADTAAVVNGTIRPGFAAFASAADTLAAIDSCDPETLGPTFQSAYDVWMPVA
jgi:hypothetical protein